MGWYPFLSEGCQVWNNFRISCTIEEILNLSSKYYGCHNHHYCCFSWGLGSSVGRARDSWWGGPGFNSRFGRPLPTGWVCVSIMWPAETKVMVCLMCGSTWNWQTLCLGAGPRYNLVVDEDVKKPNKPNQAASTTTTAPTITTTTITTATLA